MYMTIKIDCQEVKEYFSIVNVGDTVKVVQVVSGKPLTKIMWYSLLNIHNNKSLR